MKRRIFTLISTFFFALPVFADNNLEPLLNKVSLTVTANQWITTQTALVYVAVNAAVTDQGIEQMQTNVLQKLNQIAQADWHILSFERQQDSSGLEKIQISAQARLQQTALGNLRDKAKEISKAGETYTISDVQFTPSDDEIRQANIQLRENIYQQVKAEIDQLNKIYPDQKFYLHQIDFANIGAPAPMANQYLMKEALVAGAAPAKNMDVGNKATLQATAVIASMPTQVSQKLPQ